MTPPGTRLAPLSDIDRVEALVREGRNATYRAYRGFRRGGSPRELRACLDEAISALSRSRNRVILISS